MRRPTGGLPVKVTFATRGSVTSHSPTVPPEPTTRLIAPAGPPPGQRQGLAVNAFSFLGGDREGAVSPVGLDASVLERLAGFGGDCARQILFALADQRCGAAK